MKKILLIGSTGQVGQELQKTLRLLGELTTLNRQQLDLTQSDKIKETLVALTPDIIVNASAYTAVDKAESEAETAMAVNAVAPKAMAQAAKEIDSNLVHISTDYVFDGKNHRPYLETDETNPLGVYGKSKLLGEQGVCQNCDRYIILRTAWVYGSRGHGNFVKTMLRLGAEREELKVVADQIGSPTWSLDIAEAIATLLAPKRKVSSGIYNFTNSGVASWYDLAIAIFAEAASLGFPLKIKNVLPITTEEYPTPAARPHYSVLAKDKYIKASQNYPPYWRNSLRLMLREWQQITNSQ